MIKKILTVAMLLLACFMGYGLYKTIQEPITFKKEKSTREEAVIAKLKEIRTAQQAFRGITGGFAHNFDTLSQVILNDSFMLVQIFGDPDDPTNNTFYSDTSYMRAADSMAIVFANGDVSQLESYLADLRNIPFAENNETFEIAAELIEYESIEVWVTEVRVQKKVFMGSEFGKEKYSNYDDRYDPSAYLKFGDMGTPNLSGNWE
jgi:hypothetical protein